MFLSYSSACVFLIRYLRRHQRSLLYNAATLCGPYPAVNHPDPCMNNTVYYSSISLESLDSSRNDTIVIESAKMIRLLLGNPAVHPEAILGQLPELVFMVRFKVGVVPSFSFCRAGDCSENTRAPDLIIGNSCLQRISSLLTFLLISLALRQIWCLQGDTKGASSPHSHDKQKWIRIRSYSSVLRV